MTTKELGTGEPRVGVCMFDLVKWLMERTNRFPKNYRVTLGDRIDQQALTMLALVQKASVRSDKIGLLRDLNEEINVLRSLTRLASDLGCINGKQYEFAARQTEEIGRQVGGWIKQQRQRGQTA